jgi:hypothetical protein
VIRRSLLLVVVAGVMAGSIGVGAQAPTPAAQPAAPAEMAPNDYRDDKSWLCRPGRKGDACDVDLTTTVIAADGTMTREAWAADPKAPIDCFYVYPTVSTDTGRNSDMTADPAELNVVRQQFARFGSKCRTFAPLYRQITLAGLRTRLAGGATSMPFESGVQYTDVRDAWQSYLKNDNQGRGFVLVGHSQGSYILEELIKQEIDGKPIQKQLVGAYILGATLLTPKGKDAGAQFKQIPLCRKPGQLGCVVNYSAFRSTVPPPGNTLFGRSEDPALSGSCTNPATLGEGSAPLRAYLATSGQNIVATAAPKPWVTDKTVDTPWVSVPGLLTAQCKSNEFATYLEITVNGNPADPRIDDITGDLGAAGKPLANWGLHLIDVNLAMGNLLDLVEQQSKAYRARR